MSGQVTRCQVPDCPCQQPTTAAPVLTAPLPGPDPSEGTCPDGHACYPLYSLDTGDRAPWRICSAGEYVGRVLA